MTVLPSSLANTGRSVPGISFAAYVREMTGHVEDCRELTQEMIWSRPGRMIWKAKSFSGCPDFYSVYRYKEFYSYSPLPLIVLKGKLDLNPRLAPVISRPNFLYYPYADTIDREVVRVGGPLRPTFRITDARECVHAMATAMSADIAHIEAMNPGFTNIVLCGGKDSLNLLLLPWKNPVLVASAPPNYDLVKSFVADNRLPFDTVMLTDRKDPATLDAETLANCCLIDLRHVRWGTELCELSARFEKRAIFWTGALGDVFLTPYWRTYAYGTWNAKSIRSRVSNRLWRLLPKQIYDPHTMAKLHVNLWRRGAMWQGTCHSIQRLITDCLVLSGYHGPNVRQVFSQLDLSRAIQDDVRPEIGARLLGRAVKYPATNPGPPPSDLRTGLVDIDQFARLLADLHVSV